ncbi:probable plastid-lipid-associated protein 4, chloroplastic isoform X4 [Solanum pennellii]|uniref:Probable plastid-lipid-associated protein 4, chloroplastic isoform X4 n=1 Tax=Solanum pennellii TaxID=28526 RepID=A0ABM1H3D4_SOLPN|nr:probable plastid-lipid-associated protein 4, chloroplastic isoform X4 [Solanum pennellii]
MATLCMSSSSPVKLHPISPFINSSFPANPKLLLSFPRRRSFFHHFTAVNYVPESLKLRARVSLFPFLFTKSEDTESLKQELLEAIAPLDRGAEATPEDQKLIDQIASKLEVANKVKEPLKSSLLNGKWELLYTTSQSILQTKATANLVPLNARRVAVKFDSFKIASLIPIKNRGSGRGELEITYLDEELRISRGNQGNLFILKMVDPSYRVPL